jgi:putative methionine-R-sulfoxide reductase with GAF domain
MPYLRKAVLEDCACLAANMREADRMEVKAASGLTPYQALLMGYVNSEICVSIVDDDSTILGMFGVVPTSVSPSTGAVWMLAAKELLKYSKRFAKESRQWVDAVQSGYDLLYNTIDERNTVHIRWIQWCGFTVLRRIPEYGVEGRPFLEFARLKD